MFQYCKQMPNLNLLGMIEKPNSTSTIDKTKPLLCDISQLKFHF